MNHIHLLGAEEVGHAGRDISSAADSMRQTSSHLDESLRMFLNRFEDLVVRLEAAIEKEVKRG
ncbi:hypothetical protein LCGC14_0674230 [marine sediment metagenome]|uniref:Uncharacterized protein n=1 Tax=marine sediment metagenome TaxID=412755 RepID=A0A0F9TBM5_9ZZZZ